MDKCDWLTLSHQDQSDEMNSDIFKKKERKKKETLQPILLLQLQDDCSFVLSVRSRAGQEVIVFSIQHDSLNSVVQIGKPANISEFRANKWNTVHYNE